MKLEAADDNLMLVLIRDPGDTGVVVGWSQQWLNKCRKEPQKVVATMNALGTALKAFSDLMHNDVPELMEVPEGPVN